MRLYVKLMSGRKRALTVTGDMDIARLRQMVSELDGMPTDSTTLVHSNGRTLLDGKTVDSYGLRPSDVVHETIGLWHWEPLSDEQAEGLGCCQGLTDN